ncbi:BMP family lipoprotein [Defluviitalea raffinosedens]|uniref:BMP family lipoprotein n=1 Tax=Defluviitalea raffinosedens TaxID=1450156 RepID=UPI00195AC789|nr:BMP family ABC transporter substrate-binding protein [Defluviitalea raffinosedens]
MKRKLISLMLAAAVSITALVGCGQSNTTKTEETSGGATQETTTKQDNSAGAELALITDVGTIDDKSFNQGSWEGVKAYAEQKGISYKYYQPSEKSDDAIMTSIGLAVKGGAKVIVCPGYLFEVPVYNAQLKYPDVTFILIDGAPHSGDYNYDIKSNVKAIYYAEEQAGFLAGYAAVQDGYRQLGFMGGIAVPAVVRFGYGFIQGADYAAQELGLAKGDVTIKYTYVGNFDASPENMSKAAAWYNEGTELIFACGGGVGNSVMKAAETAGTKVIGVDVDQSGESETVITSAMKNLSKSVYDAIDEYYRGTFEGGTAVTLDVKTNNVQLPMETSRFKQFTQEQYTAIYNKIADGSIQINKNDVAENVADLPTNLVKVEPIQ